jgi:hypothetical protein
VINSKVLRKASVLLAGLALSAGVAATAAPLADAAVTSRDVGICHDPWVGGDFLCGDQYGPYGENLHQFPNGTYQAFVVAPNHEVYSYWTYTNGSWSGWNSMGGWVQSAVDTNTTDPVWAFTIHSIGGDGNPWCRDRSDGQYGSWNDWHRC